MTINNLTKLSAPSVRDLTISCGVKQILIGSYNTIGEDHTFFDILSHLSSKLIELSIINFGCYFKELAKGNKLETLWIKIENATDKTYDVIASKIKENTSLWMNTNNVSAYDAHQL